MKVLRLIAVFAAGYLAMWGATKSFGPAALKRQMFREAKVVWERCYKEQEVRNKEHPEYRGFKSMAFEGGPDVEVKLLSCSAPFFFQAETSRSIGGLNGGGTVGHFFYTPWRVYILSEERTWIS